MATLKRIVAAFLIVFISCFAVLIGFSYYLSLPVHMDKLPEIGDKAELYFRPPVKRGLPEITSAITFAARKVEVNGIIYTVFLYHYNEGISSYQDKGKVAAVRVCGQNFKPSEKWRPEGFARTPPDCYLLK